MPDLLKLPWATGDSNGGMTAIFAVIQQIGEPNELIMVAAAESWELADHMVVAHNASLEA